MKRFLFKAISLLIAVSATEMLLFFMLPNDPNSYLLGDRYKRGLLASTPSPRIILVGGSNLALGIDSGMLSEAFDRPVVNMGLKVDFGLDYMLNEVQPWLGSGDIVLVVPEYELMLHLLHGEHGLLKLFMLDRTALQYIQPLRYLPMLASLGPIVIQERVHNILDYIIHKLTTLREKTVYEGLTPIYKADVFDQYGDVISHLDRDPEDVRSQADKFIFREEEGFNLNHKAVERVNAFAEFAARKGARVLFCYPCIPEEYYSKNQVYINTMEETLNKELNVPVISAPEDHVYPVSLFFDTVYHLTSSGRVVRTQRLIKEMKSALVAP